MPTHDAPNQVNNVLAFPSVFRAALDVRATSVNQAMKLAASRALAALVRESRDAFGPEYLIPRPLDSQVLLHVAPAVAMAAVASGVARRPSRDWSVYGHSLAQRMQEAHAAMTIA